jgi:cobalt-zinc-cadmium efflux system protein
MSGNHEFPNPDKKLKIGLILNSSFTIFEFIIGILSGSLALISDAGHNLTDSLSILISLSASKISKKEANLEHSYGYGRATILAALINSVMLLGLALYIYYEAYKRILNPEPVQGGLVAIVALVGLTINGSMALLFLKNKNDLNIKSAFLNMVFDAISSFGALIAGLIIAFTGMTIFDPLISILIGTMLIISSFGIVRDAVHILLEGLPAGIDIAKVKELIGKAPMVKGVDDMHIWAISSQYAALSCHVVIEDCDVGESAKIVKQIKEELLQEFNIRHATIETELIECLPDSNK